MVDLPEGLDYQLIFTGLFALFIVLGALFGLLRGFRNSVYALILKVIFYAVFFLTLTPVVRLLWNAELGFAIGQLANVEPAIAGAGSLSEALPMLLESLLGDTLGGTLENPEFLAFAEALGMFALKIVWFILYFTVFKLLYHLFFWIVRLIIFKNQKKHGKKRRRLLGSAVGVLNGAVTVFVMLIFIGGLMNIAGSFLGVLDATVYDTQQEATTLSSDSPSLAETNDDPLIPEDTQEIIDEARAMVEGYESNPFAIAADALWIETPQMPEGMPLHLLLFDEIFSFEYQDRQVSFRKELSIVGDITSVAVDSEYAETQNLADIDPDDIESVFGSLSNSDLFTALIPLGIEIGADYLEVELPEDVQAELYDIAWDDEVFQLGAIVKTGFEIVHNAGLLEEDPDYETVTFDGDEVRGLFDSLAESDLVTMSAYVAIEPLLREAGGNFEAVVTVPEGLEWDDEFRAFGALAGEILDTEITLADLEEGSFDTILGAIAGVDTTVALDSLLISHALKNVLSGEGDFEAVEELTVHDDIVWFDELDEDDEITEKGELRNLLLAVNELMRLAADIDFDEPDVETLLVIDENAFDALLASDILAHTAGEQLMALDGDELTIPTKAREELTVDQEPLDVVSRGELDKLYGAFMALELEDLEFDELETTLLQSLEKEDEPGELDEDKSDALLASDIIHATLSTTLLDLTEEEDAPVNVPHYDVEGDSVRTYDEEDDLEYIDRSEFTAILRAVVSLELESFDDVEDLSLEKITDNIDTMLESAILHATLSTTMIDIADDADPDETSLVVPHYTQEEAELRIKVGENDEATTYILKSELVNLVHAVDVVGDFDDLDDIDPEIDLATLEDDEDRATVVASAILQATVSEVMLDLAEEEEGNEDGAPLVVPHYDEHDDAMIRIVTGQSEDPAFEEEDTSFEYIDRDELDRTLLALIRIGFDDVEDIDEDTIDLGNLEDDEHRADFTASSILQATLSQELIDMAAEEDAQLAVPHYDEDGNLLRLQTGDEGDGTDFEYVLSGEIDAMILSLIAIEMTDFDDFDGENISIEPLEDDDRREDFVNSAVLQATFSQQLIEESDEPDAALAVPHYTDDDSTDIRIATGETEDPEFADEDTTFEYVSSDELDAMILSLIAIDLTDFDDFDGENISIEPLEDDDKREDFVASAILQATFSQQLIEESDEPDASLAVPHYEEDETPLRLATGDEGDGTDFEYISGDELDAMILALIAIDLTDFDDFDGENISIEPLEDDDKREDFVASAILQATFSQQLIEESDEPDASLAVPHYAEDDATEVRIATGDEGQETDFEYISSDELDAMILALIAIDLTDFDDFDGENISIEPLEDDDKREDFVASAILQATFSQQLIEEAGEPDASLAVPHYAEDDATEVRIATGDEGQETDFEYISSDELDAMILALIAIDLTDFDDFDGENISIEPLEDDDKREDFVSSAVLQATFSQQLIEEAGEPDASLAVPHYAEDDATEVRIATGDEGQETDFEYISSDELDAMILALIAIELTDFDDFDGEGISIAELEDDDKREDFVSSAVLQATFSEQLRERSDDEQQPLYVPHYADTGDATRIETGDATEETDFEYIVSEEIDAMILALLALELTDFDDFDGEISITQIVEEELLSDILASSIFHGTLSNELVALDEDENVTVTVPHYDRTETLIRAIVGEEDDDAFTGEPDTTFEYVLEFELEALTEALYILGIDDVSDFEGELSIATIVEDDLLDDLMESAILHSTLSRQTIDVGDDGHIQVPFFTEDMSEEVRISLGDTEDGGYRDRDTTVEYLTLDEVTALFEALDLLGVDDVRTYDGDIDLEAVFTEPDTLLASNILQATLSEQVFDLAEGALFVPEETIGNGEKVRWDVYEEETEDTYQLTYIDRGELEKLLEALDELGLDDLETVDIGPGTVFVEDDDDFNDLLDVLMASTIVHATLSENILEHAVDGETEDFSPTLAVPNIHRNEENIRDEWDLALDDPDNDPLGTMESIEEPELRDLLTGLRVLDLGDFEDDIDSSVITALDEEDLDTLFQSSSLHLTAGDMLNNAVVGDEIPDIVLVEKFDVGYEITSNGADTDYPELRDFILAAAVVAGDFTDAEFDAEAIAELDQTERETVLTSVIVRNIVTEEFEDVYQIVEDQPIDDEHYMEDDEDILSKEGALYVIDVIEDEF